MLKNWKPRRYPSIENWQNHLWYVTAIEYHYAIGNNERDGFRETWEDLNELKKDEVSKTKTTNHITKIALPRQTILKDLSILTNVMPNHESKGLIVYYAPFPPPDREVTD